jgi:hypothetical protein
MKSKEFNELNHAINVGDANAAKRLASSTGLISPDDVDQLIHVVAIRKSQKNNRGLRRL